MARAFRAINPVTFGYSPKETTAANEHNSLIAAVPRRIIACGSGLTRAAISKSERNQFLLLSHSPELMRELLKPYEYDF